MIQTKNVHLQFADYFQRKELLPYLYLLSKKLSEGHVCVDLKNVDWKTEIEEEPYLEKYKVSDKADLKGNDLVSLEKAEIYDRPLVLSGDNLYLQRYFLYETSILDSIRSLIESEIMSPPPDLGEEFKEILRELFSDNTTGSTDWQAAAAISAVLNHFTIITGGPGTGKTTTLSKVLRLLYSLQPDMRVALAAPTGKAAARMAESLKNAHGIPAEFREKLNELQPSTLHRLLGTKRDSIYFRHNRENPLPYDLVIVDEASMIDVALFAKLLEAVKPGSRLILLGDKDQLASVEAGSLFGDLCRFEEELNRFSNERVELINSLIENPMSHISPEAVDENMHPLFEHIVELQHSFRFSGEGGIGKLSRAVITNDSETILSFYEIPDPEVVMDENYEEKIFNALVEGYREYIDEPDPKKALEKLNRVRVLCAVREGEEGVYAMNRKTEQYLQSQGLINLNSEFYIHRPVMVTSNNYELGLFNGDIGIVREDKNGEKRVWFETSDGTLKSFLPSFLDAVETVFAMTIHKSQGSEFDKVLVVLPKDSEAKILTRELLYTGITRAKNEVILRGKKEVILACSEKRVERGSGIKERF